QGTGHSEMPSTRLGATQGFVDQKQVRPQQLRERDRLSLPGIELCGDASELVRRDRLNAKPGRRFGQPAPHRKRRLAGSELLEHGRGYDDLTIEAVQKLRLLEKNEVVKGTAVRDNDHRSGRMPRLR